MRVGVLQITSVLDPKINLEKIENFLREAQSKKVQAVFLPEAFYTYGSEAIHHFIEKNSQGYQDISALAKKYQVYLLGGSVPFKHNGKIFNRCINFDPQGGELVFYDKIHLFACKIQGELAHQESNKYQAGHTPQMLSINDWKIGLSICFDLRFADMFTNYRKQGANLLTISSAFTVTTGKVHWHTLLKARAIENQSYVVASAQWGSHNDRFKTYGHSLIVDPWGHIVEDAGEGEKMLVADLDLDLVKQVRDRILMGS